jgi:DNA-binding IscR family transcriptional regulator
MRREADGGLHVNQYPTIRQIGPEAPSTPWCMHLAGADGLFRFVAFDLDGKTPEAIERAADEADVLTNALAEVGIPFVVCRSSAAGGYHVWIAVRGGATVDVMKALTAAAGAVLTSLDHGMLHNPATGACRPPGAPHRDGSASTIIRGRVDALTNPTATADDLVALTAALRTRRPALRPENSTPSGPVDATHTTHRRLTTAGSQHMATIDGGSNPSWTAWMCLLAAANAGWTFGDVEHAARTAPGMEHYRTKNTGRGTRRRRSPEEAARRLERQWAKAQAAAATYRALPAEGPAVDLTDLAAIVDTADELLTSFRVNPGRWNSSEPAAHERGVLTALIHLTLHTGKRRIAASIRTLALLAGMGRTTAADALTRLAAAGYVTRTAAADGTNAAEWRLRDAVSTTQHQVRSQPFKNPRPRAALFDRRTELVHQIEDDLHDVAHDLFTRAGLGYQAGRVYASLRTAGPTTLAAAADRLGVRTGRLTTILSRLRKHRLIVRVGDAWRLHARDLRSSAARTLGVAGALAARAALYELERTVWTWWQAEVEQRHTAPRRRTRRPHVTARTLTFTDEPTGERQWPRYPRDADRRGDHREARFWAENGMLAPDSLWWSSTAA